MTNYKRPLEARRMVGLYALTEAFPNATVQCNGVGNHILHLGHGLTFCAVPWHSDGRQDRDGTGDAFSVERISERNCVPFNREAWPHDIVRTARILLEEEIKLRAAAVDELRECLAASLRATQPTFGG